MDKPECYLDQWQICNCKVHGDRGQHLHGVLVGRHPKLGTCPEELKGTEQEIITTSSIVQIDFIADIAETRNTLYCLGNRKG